MNREILFRGKTVGRDWVYGNYAHIKKDFSTVRKGHYISNSVGSPFAYLVRAETVGQFTGLTDKNGVKIFEGDKVRILYTDWPSKSKNDSRSLEQYLIDISKIGVVVFSKDGWYLEFYSDKFNETYLGDINHGKHGFIEIIGNIHDNT
jgi:uncharacterized phage protein (TIGR01671 family)